MLLLFDLILLTTIWCLGVKIITAPGMLLENLGAFAEDRAAKGQLIYEPLLACEFCLPSIHSLVGYLFAVVLGVIYYFSWSLVFIYPLVAMGSSITTGFIWTGYKTLVGYRDLTETQIDFYETLMDDEEGYEESIFDKEINHN